MPSPRSTPPRHAVALSRRGVLVGAVGTVAAACSPYELQTQRPGQPRPTPSAAEVPPVDPDVVLAATVLTAVQALLTQVESTLQRHPRLARTLESARAAHVAHVALLDGAVPAGRSGLSSALADPTASGSDPTSPSSSPSSSPSTRVPRDRARAVRVLARAEDDLVLTAKQAAFAAESGTFARVLASLAGSAAQQAATLRNARLPGTSG